MTANPRIVDAIRHEVELLLRNHPELAEDDVLRADMVEGETQAFEFLRKLELKRREALALRESLHSTIAEMKSRAARYDRRDGWLRHLMMKIMESAQLRRVELPEATLIVGLAPPKVIITDEEALPIDCWRIKKEIDKVKIRDWIKEGVSVNGAHLSNQEPVLSIRK